MNLKEKIETKYLVMPDSCWIWTDSLDKDGYGSFWDGNKNLRAHRASFEIYIGIIPDGLVIDHLCRNRACVNPYHLEPVTTKENSIRSPRTRVCEHGVGSRRCNNGCKRKVQLEYEKKYRQKKREKYNFSEPNGWASRETR